jgi:hypothetical protein
MCKGSFQTSRGNQKLCDNPACKKAYQYLMWLKWTDEHKERRREIARESLRRKKREGNR